MNYTKGQWEVQHSFNVFCGRRVIASCGGYADNWKVDEVHNENIANAKLIAAAPDLRESLEAVLEDCGELLSEFTRGRAIDAVNKAKGIKE